jgi:hypothetical protein
VDGAPSELASLLPIGDIGEVTQNERDRKGLLVRYRVRKAPGRLIDANLGDRDLSPLETARYNVRRLVDTEALAEAAPVGAVAMLDSL